VTYQALVDQIAPLEIKLIRDEATPEEVLEYIRLKALLVETPEDKALEEKARREVELILGISRRKRLALY
jgi:hypothetical protein